MGSMLISNLIIFIFRNNIVEIKSVDSSVFLHERRTFIYVSSKIKYNIKKFNTKS